MRVYCIVGVTNTGKTTLIDEALELDGVAAAQVGKEFRRRYPPGHFEGQGAPDHTENEAMEILDMFVERAGDAKVLLVDGQPRREDQVAPVLGRFHGVEVIWLYEPDTVIEERARQRATSDEDLQLSLDRIKNDKVQLFNVIAKLRLYGIPIHVFSSDSRPTALSFIEERV